MRTQRKDFCGTANLRKAEGERLRKEAEALLADGNLRRACRVFGEAARLGDVLAHVKRGVMKLNGEGCARRPREAAEHFLAASHAGHDRAPYFLALLLLNGEGVTPDFAEAARFLRLARRRGIAEAACALGTLYREGFGVPRNLAKAKALYQEAAAAGVERAGELLADFPNHPHAPHGQDAEEEP